LVTLIEPLPLVIFCIKHSSTVAAKQNLHWADCSMI